LSAPSQWSKHTFFNVTQCIIGLGWSESVHHQALRSVVQSFRWPPHPSPLDTAFGDKAEGRCTMLQHAILPLSLPIRPEFRHSTVQETPRGCDVRLENISTITSLAKHTKPGPFHARESPTAARSLDNICRTVSVRNEIVPGLHGVVQSWKKMHQHGHSRTSDEPGHRMEPALTRLLTRHKSRSVGDGKWKFQAEQGRTPTANRATRL
jgi:hypothetical protein